jgi:zinc protease
LPKASGSSPTACAARPSEAEISRELQNLRTSALSAVEGNPPSDRPQRAQQLIGAIDDHTIVASAPTTLALIDELSPQMTPQTVGTAMRELFSGAGPRLVLLSPQPIPAASVNAALAAAEKAAPATRQADRNVTMNDLPPLGPPGKEVSRQHIADLGVTIVRFANGSSLVFKRTDFEKGSVQVQLRFGEGLTGLPKDRPSLAWLGGLVGPSGLATLDLDAMERLSTGRRIGPQLRSDRGLRSCSAARPTATDLADQLRLFADQARHSPLGRLLARPPSRRERSSATISASPRLGPRRA